MDMEYTQVEMYSRKIDRCLVGVHSIEKCRDKFLDSLSNMYSAKKDFLIKGIAGKHLKSIKYIIKSTEYDIFMVQKILNKKLNEIKTLESKMIQSLF